MMVEDDGAKELAASKVGQTHHKKPPGGSIGFGGKPFPLIRADMSPVLDAARAV